MCPHPCVLKVRYLAGWSYRGRRESARRFRWKGLAGGSRSLGPGVLGDSNLLWHLHASLLPGRSTTCSSHVPKPRAPSTTGSSQEQWVLPTLDWNWHCEWKEIFPPFKLFFSGDHHTAIKPTNTFYFHWFLTHLSSPLTNLQDRLLHFHSSASNLFLSCDSEINVCDIFVPSASSRSSYCLSLQSHGTLHDTCLLHPSHYSLLGFKASLLLCIIWYCGSKASWPFALQSPLFQLPFNLRWLCHGKCR